MTTPRITSNRYLVLRYLYEQIHTFIKSLNFNDTNSVLDVGCGLKPYEHCFTNSKLSYFGVDLHNRHADAFAIGEMLPLKDECFDLVLCTQVLEHVTEPEKVLNEIRRVLKKHGVLILSTHGFWVEGHETIDYWRWTIQGLERIITLSGFSIVNLASMDSFSSMIQTLILWLPNKLRPLVVLLNCIAISLSKLSINGPRMPIVHIIKAVSN
jgi:SAM-dependent methyltransferase